MKRADNVGGIAKREFSSVCTDEWKEQGNIAAAIQRTFSSVCTDEWKVHWHLFWRESKSRSHPFARMNEKVSVQKMEGLWWCSHPFARMNEKIFVLYYTLVVNTFSSVCTDEWKDGSRTNMAVAAKVLIRLHGWMKSPRQATQDKTQTVLIRLHGWMKSPMWS